MSLIYIAKLGRAVGLKGAQKLHIESDFPEQFKKGNIFLTKNNQTLTVESYNSKSNTIKFEEISSIDEAKKLTNKELFATQDETKQNCILDKNQYFWFDMIGCSIMENNECLGTITDIQRLPLTDYLYIKTTTELISKKYPNSFLIPYQKEYILDVDLDSKIIKTINCKDILEAS